jgi:prepilin-type N-terminal cleavage/methylation domain-containing protein
MTRNAPQDLRRPMPTMGRQSAKGFTLLELLVVTVLSVGLAMMTAQMWRHFGAQAADLTARTTAAQELKLALESLSDDMGGVAWAETTPGGGLRVCRETPGQGYEIIAYAARNGQLVRGNSSAGTVVPIAGNVSGFSAHYVTPTLVQIKVAVTAGTLTRKATLFWSPP